MRYSSKMHYLFLNLHKYKYDCGDSKTYIKIAQPLGSYTHLQNINCNGVVWNQSLRSNNIGSIFWDFNIYVQVHALKWRHHFLMYRNLILHCNVMIFLLKYRYFKSQTYVWSKCFVLFWLTCWPLFINL